MPVVPRKLTEGCFLRSRTTGENPRGAATRGRLRRTELGMPSAPLSTAAAAEGAARALPPAEAV
jgi:hypothetical protein